MSDHQKPIYVTQPSLPPLAEFMPYLESIWENKILTNSGPFHQQLEAALCEFLGVPYLSLFSNGTLALLTACQALRLSGEVITTPYSFVATSHALLWNGLKPVFVDIDPITFNIDPKKIEAAITPNTTAIMPVHCYGNPCDVDAIQKIADDYCLRVIYDAAHAFGVGNKAGSLLKCGDLSVLSFHATKVFNTFEGGAIISPDLATKKRIDQLKNFGFVNEVTVTLPGINAKMSEVNAAFGLLQLKYVAGAMEKREAIAGLYRELLKGCPGIECSENASDMNSNNSYFPVLVTADYPLSRDALHEDFKTYNIFTRRYFYPLISDFPVYRDMHSARAENLPVAKDIANKVLCLPIFPDLTEQSVRRIADILWRRNNGHA